MENGPISARNSVEKKRLFDVKSASGLDYQGPTTVSDQTTRRKKYGGKVV
ncbi:MAG: hypothetical protein RIS70_4204 [Planctomycetota bacterium]